MTFALRPGGAPALRYRELAERAGQAPARRPTLADVRAAVLALRRQEVDGDRRRRSQPAQRRLVLHEPDRAAAEADEVAARASPARDRGAGEMPRWPAPTAGQALGRLAHRARRHPQGAAPRRGRRLHRPRARARPPRRRLDGRPARRWPGRSRKQSGPGSASRWSRSRSLSASPGTPPPAEHLKDRGGRGYQRALDSQA